MREVSVPTESTDLVRRGDAGRWLPGHAPKSPGRPRGSRNKLADSFLDAMLASFNELTESGLPAGLDAIRRTRDIDPSTYLRVIAGILPKEMTGADGEALFSGITVNFVSVRPESQSNS